MGAFLNEALQPHLPKKCRVIICLAKDIEMRSQAQLALDPSTVWNALLWGCLHGKTGQANPQTILGSPRRLYPRGPSLDLESSNMQTSRLNGYLLFYVLR